MRQNDRASTLTERATSMARHLVDRSSTPRRLCIHPRDTYRSCNSGYDERPQVGCFRLEVSSYQAEVGNTRLPPPSGIRGV